MYGGLMLAISIFLPWYHHKGNLGGIAGKSGDVTVSGWQTHTIMRFLLLLAAAAPFILAYIIAQDHALSWPRGEMTAVTAIAAFGLIGYHAFVSKPGDPTGQVSLRFGLFLAILATGLMLVGAATRSSETERPRKPPGTI
ncbi:MAG: hypothetical protein QOI98_1847 [Solirubrobacteraceae bacterium]|jgi:hypothetical protein|nr:hypothetical protein [Solirubrobacteraceae bacterium]